MKNIVFILIVNLIGSFTLIAQTLNESYTLSGVVVKGKNNQPLTGANLLSTNHQGTKTNELGEFSIQVYFNDTLSISFIGYKTISYVVPHHKKGKFMIKFKMYRDSVSLSEVEVFPWPTYKEFKKAFLAMDKQNEKISMEDVNFYQDPSTTPATPTALSPISFVYDRLLDKQAKMKRRLNRRRNTIRNAQIE